MAEDMVLYMIRGLNVERSFAKSILDTYEENLWVLEKEGIDTTPHRAAIAVKRAAWEDYHNERND